MYVLTRLGLGVSLGFVLLVATFGLKNISDVPAQAAELTVCPPGPPTCVYTSVQAAVDAAADGDVIRVAMGTYTGVNNYGGKPQVLYISKSVIIRGGYSSSFTDPPSPWGNPTILDAQGQGRVVVITGPVTVTLEGLEITGGNSAAFSGDGAGLYAVSATVTLSQSRIYSNTANALGVGNGGGAAFVDTQGTLSLNAVYDNQAGYGGGLFIGAAEMRLVNNTVNDNQAASGGGGMVLALDTSVLTGNLISGNVAGQGGGGLDLVNSRAVFQGNTIISNTAGQEGGGGLYIDQDSSPTLTNNFIVDNHTSGEGAGVTVRSSLPRFLHNTIASNTGDSGLYVFNQNWPGYPQSRVALTSTILVSQTVGVTVTAGNTVTLDGVLWYGNGLNTGGSGTVTATHSFTGDPAFVNPTGGDYHILPASAAINRGLDAGVSVDFDGETRDSSPDLGADEITSLYLPLILAE